MNPLNSIKILSTRIDDIILSEIPPIIDTFLNDGKSHQIITANPLMLLEVKKNLKLKEVFADASLVVPEGSGILWASKHLKTPLREKIPGIDLMIFLLNYAQKNGNKVFFLGTKEKIISKAVDKIKQKFPKLIIAGYNNGFFSNNEPDVISIIKSSGADILFVGLAIPYQEIWIYKNIEQTGVKIAMGVGGSFDVLSDNLKRAPSWMIKLNIEWLFRVIQQPWRIKRIIKLAKFIIQIIKGTATFI